MKTPRTFAEELESLLVETMTELLDEDYATSRFPRVGGDFSRSKFAKPGTKPVPVGKGGLNFGKQRPEDSPQRHNARFPKFKDIKPLPDTRPKRQMRKFEL